MKAPGRSTFSKSEADVLLSRQPLSVLRPVMRSSVSLLLSNEVSNPAANKFAFVYVNTWQENDKEWDELKFTFSSLCNILILGKEKKTGFQEEGTEGLLEPWSWVCQDQS